MTVGGTPYLALYSVTNLVAIGRVSATYGTGEACDACSLAVTTEQVLYKLGRMGVQELIFHNACFAIWKLERDRMHPSRAPAGPRF